MKIGSSLVLRLDNSKYQCKVIDKDEYYIYIDYPFNLKTGKTPFLIKGTHLQVTFISQSGEVFQFNTDIVSYIRSEIPSIAINYPKERGIKRIQRREFVRINTAVDVSIYNTETKDIYFTTVTIDISAGGISIIVPNRYRMEISNEYSIKIALPIKSDDVSYINVVGRVVRLGRKNSFQTASIKFINIDSKLEQQIVRFCFKKQSDERRKELE